MAASGDRAARAGALVRVVLAALPGLLGLVLLAVGAWLAWPPAGLMVAGALLLADRVASARRPGGEP
jgi:hypothetical protein